MLDCLAISRGLRVLSGPVRPHVVTCSRSQYLVLIPRLQVATRRRGGHLEASRAMKGELEQSWRLYLAQGATQGPRGPPSRRGGFGRYLTTVQGCSTKFRTEAHLGNRGLTPSSTGSLPTPHKISPTNSVASTSLLFVQQINRQRRPTSTTRALPHAMLLPPCNDRYNWPTRRDTLPPLAS